ncbi:MAG: hypothetical protein AABY22_06445 [Nanoarchaeota archaeon]
MQKYFNIAAVSIIILLILLYYRSCNRIENLQNNIELNKALNDTLVKTRNTLGQEISSRKALYTDLPTFKKLNGIKDSAILELQKRVDKNTQSATIIKNTTVTSALGGTDIIIQRDTIIKDSIVYIYPEYRKVFQDGWFWAKITSNKDTTILNFQTYNEFVIQHIWKRQDGLFKPKSLIIEVTNLNPNTETTSLQSFVIKPKSPRKLIIFAGGIVIGAVAVSYLRK